MQNLDSGSTADFGAPRQVLLHCQNFQETSSLFEVAPSHDVDRLRNSEAFEIENR